MNFKKTQTLMSISFVIAIFCFSSIFTYSSTNKSRYDKNWSSADSIKKRIILPSFPNKKYRITDFGAAADGKKDCSQAIRSAINVCSKRGGGMVVVPAGVYQTGPIHLKSNVNLHLDKGAVLKFSTRPEDYLPLVHTRWEGVELMNYSPLIYAFEQKNIAITGEGTLDGCASELNWWPWKGLPQHGWKKGTLNQTDSANRPALLKMGENNTPVEKRIFGSGHYLRPQFIQPYRCKNVLIEGVKVINSPMWILHPVMCTNVTISKVQVKSDGPNTDGCDPESCKNVLIKDCFFNTGDDCIAIKSGRNGDGRRINVPCENIVIQNCTMANGHGGIVIGSEISGGVRNLFAENCIMNSPHLDRAIRIKSSSARGGIVENLYFRNINVATVKKQAIIVTMFYEDTGSFLPIFRNIEIRDMCVNKGGDVAVALEGYKESPVQNFHLINVQIDGASTPYYLSNTRNVQFEQVRINGKLVNNPKDTITKSVSIAR